MPRATESTAATLSADTAIREIQERMSAHAAHVRSAEPIAEAVQSAWGTVRRLLGELTVATLTELPIAFRAADLALTHALYLEAIKEYLERGGHSRGSALVLGAPDDQACQSVADEWRFKCNEPGAYVDQRILEIALADDGGVRKEWVDIRPIPDENEWFESVWKDYLEKRIIR